ncbi:hypothetical protein V6Z11_D01G172300 [Gossypium hirsutum]
MQEASKARIYHSGDDSVALVAQTVLLYVFENILKLLHPFMKFVTEELWQALPNRREALIISFWPQTSLPRSTDLVKRFENLQVLIVGYAGLSFESGEQRWQRRRIP